MRLVLAALLLAPAAAAAHAMLEAAIPPVGSTVTQAPTELALTYSESIEPRFSKVAVTDATGARLDQGDLRVDPQNATHLIVPVKPLPPGTYTVTWHAVSVDAHRTQGSYHFKVSAP
jgi:methionine-rich copper-binding protein CopC